MISWNKDQIEECTDWTMHRHNKELIETEARNKCHTEKGSDLTGNRRNEDLIKTSLKHGCLWQNHGTTYKKFK